MAHEHHHHEHHHHEHDDEEEASYGMALGVRLVERNGEFYYAEAEIAPYLDQQDELGATLVFHPLEGVDPTAESEEDDRPPLAIDIDDDLSRDPSEPVPAQFKAIVRQLSQLSSEKLIEYLGRAEEGEQG